MIRLSRQPDFSPKRRNIFSSCVILFLLLTKGRSLLLLTIPNNPLYVKFFFNENSQLITVRVEEVVLVSLVLLLWIGAIALFFNRWGKIRMLEPYQPKFYQQPHRPSCPLVPLSPPHSMTHQLNNSLPRTQKIYAHRMSFSKYNVNALTDPLSILPSPIIKKPRRSSVFVGSSLIINKTPRRAKSATDIHYIGIKDHRSSGSLSGSVVPLITTRDRLPASLATNEGPIFITRRRPSAVIEKSPCLYNKARRSSCYVEKINVHYRNVNSCETSGFKIPPVRFYDSFPNRPITFSMATTHDSSKKRCVSQKPKISRSFEQPTTWTQPKPQRMASSFDVSSSFTTNRKCSMPEEEAREAIAVHVKVKNGAPDDDDDEKRLLEETP
ncbi:hypothetical protein ABEB36_015365 [Hypothenemus hampei]|uniref:Fibronectin type III domain-containing protein n=1 Tax=Hypothenemus hampei TaxID=57062 RepID=A0ABD1E092_HYPHA